MRSTSGLSLTTAEHTTTAAAEAVAAVYRSDWGRLLSVLVVSTRRLDLAEDALAEAFSRAATRWPVDGVPVNPASWLFVAARRIILGRLRSEAVAGRAAPLLAVRGEGRGDGHVDGRGDGRRMVSPTFEDDEPTLPDERLQPVLLCCHPALEPAARSALALRLVIGTSTDEIARLFLVPTATMAARITRAKRKIVAAGIPLVLPVEEELTLRLEAVTRTIYLAFTASYAPGTGNELIRTQAAGDAVRLALMLHQLVPGALQARALLALVMFQHARRDARVCNGELITLADQDRTRWHQSEIDSAVRLLATIPPSSGYAEELRLQALAAQEHATAKSSATTNWTNIAEIYTTLEACTGSPVVRLNRAVAVAEMSDPGQGLEMLEGLREVLDHHHRFHGVRADLARRAGKPDMARASYVRAIELCGNEVERSFLRKQLDALLTDGNGNANEHCERDHAIPDSTYR
jgi:RNA polymerase sigma-70 factor, ECF subfamily